MSIFIYYHESSNCKHFEKKNINNNSIKIILANSKNVKYAPNLLGTSKFSLYHTHNKK